MEITSTKHLIQVLIMFAILAFGIFALIYTIYDWKGVINEIKKAAEEQHK